MTTSRTNFLSVHPALADSRAAHPAATQAPAGPSFFSGLIRTVFARHAEGAPATAVLLTAPHRGCGVSFASSCIVAELASTGARILLADAQSLALLRNPETAYARCERVGPGHVWVLGHRQTRANDPDFHLAVVSPLTVLQTLRQEFTHIVIDAPALDESDLALLFATSVAGVVLVARANHTEAQAMTAAYNRLTLLGAHVFGSVYNSR